ncbi:MAG: hydantoinase B/oxoprolinase family protein [Chloroflexi bacterium]|nr:hydantoinase B/oxoprolinase family protein [Chloroflexota bacterium]
MSTSAMQRREAGDRRTAFDPIELEVLWNRLIAIVDEAAAALVRTAFSAIVRESNDFACVLLDPHGRSVAQSSISVPSFIGTMPRTLKELLKVFPLETWKPGDVVVTNDPWLGTGHLPDFSMVTPVFYRDRLVGFAGSIAHTPDIGGTGWSPDASEVYEEGFRIPPSKLVEEGRPNELLFRLIQANVRVPEQVMGDLRAQIASGQVCAHKLREFLDEQGLDELTPLAETIQARSEAAMRRAISQIPDGEYRHTLFTDGLDEPLRIECAVRIAGERLVVDYTGTSPQVPKGINSVYNYTYAYTAYPVKCALDPTTPNNEGSFLPIEVIAPEGSVVNPRFPAAVNSRGLTAHYLTAAIYGALAEVIPNQVIGESGAPANRTVLSGYDGQGQRFSIVIFTSGGLGARSNRDGTPATAFPSNAGGSSLEVLENQAPIVFLGRRLVPGSGGEGMYRGGLAQEVTVKLLPGASGTTASLHTERLRFAPAGVRGGAPGGLAQVALNGGPLQPKGRTRVKAGDAITIRTPGGGGYGPASQRDPELLAFDRREGLIEEDHGNS